MNYTCTADTYFIYLILLIKIVPETELNNFNKTLFILERIVTSNNFSSKQIEFKTRHISNSMYIKSYYIHTLTL